MALKSLIVLLVCVILTAGLSSGFVCPLVLGIRELQVRHGFRTPTALRQSSLPIDPNSRDGIHASAPSLASTVAASRVKRLDELLGRMYQRAISIRCPFFRRRSYDILDATNSVFKFVVARHKSLSFLPEPQSADLFATTAEEKSVNLPLAEIAQFIRQDWKADDGHRGYYITGRLSRNIYSDGCLFDGPDPDMPVKGLRKYQASASQLFELKSSRAEMLSLAVDEPLRTITVRWRIHGNLNLPWHPKVKPWTGTTQYVISDQGLVEQHLETWDITVADAFVSTLFPGLGKVLWGGGAECVGEVSSS